MILFKDPGKRPPEPPAPVSPDLDEIEPEPLDDGTTNGRRPGKDPPQEPERPAWDYGAGPVTGLSVLLYRRSGQAIPQPAIPAPLFFNLLLDHQTTMRSLARSERRKKIISMAVANRLDD